MTDVRTGSGATVTSWFGEAARSSPNATALVAPDGGRCTYAELERSAAAMAGGLAAREVGRGTRVGVFLPNGRSAVEVFLAVARLGGLVVGVNSRLRSEDLHSVLEAAAIDVLVFTGTALGIDFARIVRAALAGMERPPVLVVEGDGGGPWSRARAVHSLAAVGQGPPMVGDLAGTADPVVAFTTSGTTGRPKLAAHDHGGVVRHARRCASCLGIGPADTGLVVLPLCGTFGFVSLLSTLAGGGRCVLVDRFDAVGVAALVEEEGATYVNGADDMLLGVLEAAERDGRALRTWRVGVFGEFAGRGRELVDRAERSGIRLSSAYGSSETFALLARRPADQPGEERARKGGTLVDHLMEVRVADPSTGSPVPAGQPGELQFRGPSVLAGYLSDEQATAAAFAPGGWLRTGDLGRVDEDQRTFEFVARLDESLRLSGFLTDPKEIEDHLAQHPGVRAAQVVGVPGAGGDVAVAFVVPAAANPPTEEELVAHCRSSLAAFKAPRRVVLVPSFPTVEGPNGVKVRKGELRQLASEILGPSSPAP